MKLIVKDWLCTNPECGSRLGRIEKNSPVTHVVINGVTVYAGSYPCPECGKISEWDPNAEALGYLFKMRKQRQEAIRASIRELEEGLHQ